AAVGEVETDEHVAGGPHRGDAVAADRRGLVELEVDVGRPQRVGALPRQVHVDVVVRARLAADVEVGQVALVVGDGAGDHRRHGAVFLGAVAEGVVGLPGRQVGGGGQLGRVGPVQGAGAAVDDQIAVDLEGAAGEGRGDPAVLQLLQGQAEGWARGAFPG